MRSGGLERSFVFDVEGYRRSVLIPTDVESVEPFWGEGVDDCGLMDRSTGKKYYAGKVLWG